MFFGSTRAKNLPRRENKAFPSATLSNLLARLLPMRLRSPLCLLVLLCSALLGASSFETADSEAKQPPSFNKEELESLLKKEHSDKVSNIYDSDNDIQCARALPGARTAASAHRVAAQVHVER